MGIGWGVLFKWLLPFVRGCYAADYRRLCDFAFSCIW